MGGRCGRRKEGGIKSRGGEGDVDLSGRAGKGGCGTGEEAEGKG